MIVKPTRKRLNIPINIVYSQVKMAQPSTLSKKIISNYPGCQKSSRQEGGGGGGRGEWKFAIVGSCKQPFSDMFCIVFAILF